MVALMWVIISVVLRGMHFGSCCFLLWILSFTNVCLFVFPTPSLQSVWIDTDFCPGCMMYFCCKKIVLESSSVFVCFGELIEGFLISWCYFNSGKMDQFVSSEEKHSLLCWVFSQSEVKHSHSWAHYIGIIYQGPEKIFPTKAFR